jgi:homoserine kinase type II
MNRVAHYTTIDQVDLPAVAQHYGINGPSLTPLAGGAANSSFRLTGSSGDFVLTILDNHDLPSAQRLAAHTQALFRLGVPTTEVVPATDGTLVMNLADRPVILKKWIEGEVREPLPSALLPEAGRILARLHALEPESSGLDNVPVGTRRLSEGRIALIPQFEDKIFAAWLTERLGRVRAAEAGRERRRTITHGDLFSDNVIVNKDGRLSVLDWETVSLDDPLLDLGMAALGLAQEDGTLVRDRVRALASGYQQVAPLSEQDVAALPMEIEHAALIIAFHRYYRHVVRFPNLSKSTSHTQMVKFVDSIADAGV